MENRFWMPFQAMLKSFAMFFIYGRVSPFYFIFFKANYCLEEKLKGVEPRQSWNFYL